MVVVHRRTVLRGCERDVAKHAPSPIVNSVQWRRSGRPPVCQELNYLPKEERSVTADVPNRRHRGGRGAVTVGGQSGGMKFGCQAESLS